MKIISTEKSLYKWMLAVIVPVFITGMVLHLLFYQWLEANVPSMPLHIRIIISILVIIVFIALLILISVSLFRKTDARVQMLTESEHKFRSLYKSILEGFVVVDMDGNIVETNQAYLDMLGYTEEEIKAKTYLDLTPSKWHEFENKIVRDEVIPLGYSKTYEKEYIRKDGSIFPIELRTYLVRNKMGEPATMWAFIHDISRRKEMEESLRVSEANYRMLFEGMQEGFALHEIICDEKGVPQDYRFLIINPAFEQITGIKASEITGKTVREVLPQTEYYWIEIYGKVALSGEPVKFEHFHQGLNKYFRVVAYSPGKGRFAVLFDDITDRWKMEEEIRSLNADLEKRVLLRTAQLEDANRELEAFSYSVSHDLRSPLRGIIGWSLALLDEAGSILNDKALDYMNKVRDEALRMGQLIDALLMLSRVSRAEISGTEVDLTSIARNYLDEVKESYNAGNYEIQIMPGMVVQGDPQLLKILVNNLLNNAFKFTQKTKYPKIEFGKMEKNGIDVFYISDNGAGFDMQYSKNLFTAFYRLHRQAEFPGTGIGLATVQRIVHRHGGKVWAEAEVDKGATFFFTIGEII